MSADMKKYCEYIQNLSPWNAKISIKQFDKYWEPIGKTVRKAMKRSALTYETLDRICLTVLGHDVANSNWRVRRDGKRN